ncbi:hypothetical protein VCRA2110O318_170006 [Vibrio crassostreae]|nr:hypothetical protein VCRA2117O328_180006 [Vibrio crassostreae]CAK2281263.1 hypothetical protein VCRA2110O318_170006 [Vibrio crassostreae]
MFLDSACLVPIFSTNSDKLKPFNKKKGGKSVTYRPFQTFGGAGGS